MKNKLKSLIRENKYIEIIAYILQNNKFLNSSGDGTFSKDINGMYSHVKTIADKYANNYPNNLKDKIVLEVGTGYTRATMLYMIKKYNIKKVYCYDRFNCLHENDNLIIEQFELDQYLSKIEYISGTNYEISKYVEKSSVDYIVSNAVLEHVDDLKLLFNILNNVLKSDGHMYHKVDLKCHNRFKKHGELYFHTFNEKLWKMMGDKIGQPNRKLLKDYLHLFENEKLKCNANITAKFNDRDVLKAKEYLQLNDKNIEEYIVSGVEFKLCKK